MKVINNSDIRHFNSARKVAEASDFERCHMGCVAVYQGTIIGIGCNTNKTHTMQQKYNQFRNSNASKEFIPKLHAEIHCINSIKYLDINFSNVKLYVYRIRKDRPQGMARPCPACMQAIKDLGIRDIYYTTNEGYCYERIQNR